MADGRKKKKNGVKLKIVLVFSLMVMLITFFSYMLSTTLEEVLADQRGEGVIITHTESETEGQP